MSRLTAPTSTVDPSLNDNGDIGLDGIRFLIASERLKKLRVLELRKTGIAGEGVASLADSHWLSTLESVDLRDNYLSFRSVEYLRGRSARTDRRSPIEVLADDLFSRGSGPISGESIDG